MQGHESKRNQILFSQNKERREHLVIVIVHLKINLSQNKERAFSFSNMNSAFKN